MRMNCLSSSVILRSTIPSPVPIKLLTFSDTFFSKDGLGLCGALWTSSKPCTAIRESGLQKAATKSIKTKKWGSASFASATAEERTYGKQCTASATTFLVKVSVALEFQFSRLLLEKTNWMIICPHPINCLTSGFSTAPTWGITMSPNPCNFTSSSKVRKLTSPSERSFPTTSWWTPGLTARRWDEFTGKLTQTCPTFSEKRSKTCYNC